MKIARTSLVLIALALFSVPALAGERYARDYHHHEGQVLNGRLHSHDFEGGVGANASYGSDCCYGGFYAGSASAMYTTGYSASSVAATAGGYAFGYIGPNP